jgi:hypothetical protein
MTTERDALRTTTIYRFHTLENNLNFLNQSKHVKNDIIANTILPESLDSLHLIAPFSFL